MLILLTVIAYALCWFCLWAEKKSKAWHPDRALLFTAGFWLAMAFVGTGWSLARLF